MKQHLSRETPTRSHNNELAPEDVTLAAYGHQLTINNGHNLVRINAPSFFKDRDFLKWLNHPSSGPATWHPRGHKAGEYSDVFTHYGGAHWDEDNQFIPEGSDTHHGPDRPGIPNHIYALIAEAVEEATGSMNNEALVWISNLEE